MMTSELPEIELEDQGAKGRYVLRGPDGAEAEMTFTKVGESKIILYIAIALVGYGNSNVFSMIFSQALTDMPEQKNEVSGLMIMGLFGGTVFPLLMGFASDAVGQMGAVAVMAVGVIYLFTYIGRLK